jgi:hypothetical protein
MSRPSFVSACNAVVLTVALAACGGGGGGDAAPAGTPPPGSGGPVVGGGTTPPPASLAWSQPAGVPASSWHWTATNPSGSVMVATAIPGGVHVSRDGGTSWTAAVGVPAGTSIPISADLSDDGQVIVVVWLNGGMYRSLDAGTSWSRIDVAFNAGENLDYESVSLSADGQRIVAAVMGGGVLASADGTAATPTFTPATIAGGGPLVSWWRALDSDASGMRVVAASHNGDVWKSDDGGATFAAVPVSVAGAAIGDAWYRLALSRDGKTLALVGNEDYGTGAPAGSRSSGLYVGRFDAGNWTFQRASDVAGNYTRVAIAADAPVIAATLSGTNGTNGQLLISSDNGTTFAPLSAPSGESVWRSIAITGDAKKAVLAGGTFFSDPGKLYVSSGPLVP